MPRKTFLKPKKGNLLVKQGRKNEGAAESAGEVMAGMQHGDERVGRGWSEKKVKNAPEPENLDAEAIARRHAIIGLLSSTIMPNSLSSKSSELMDRRSLLNKLNKCTLKELRELTPDRLKRMPAEKLKEIADGAEELPDGEKVEIQDLYKDLSP